MVKEVYLVWVNEMAKVILDNVLSIPFILFINTIFIINGKAVLAIDNNGTACHLVKKNPPVEDSYRIDFNCKETDRKLLHNPSAATRATIPLLT